MKITDKIVTSVTLPQQTNVLWHNPKTGELKMFGNKGWGNAGGSPGSGTSGGYPVVTVTEDFNIEAQPNTFYNIKNSADDEVNINCSEGYSVDGMNKHIMFTGNVVSTSNPEDIIWLVFASYGGVLVDDTSVDGYKYRMDLDFNTLTAGLIPGILPIYFSDAIKSGGSVKYYAKENPSLNVNLDTITYMDNIQILNENVNDLVWVTLDGISYPHIFIEVENDNEEYQYKYNVWGAAAMNLDVESIYTNEPYTTATNFYLSGGTNISSMADSIKVKSNIPTPSSNIANEFVFNVNSPANITFNQEVKWNNNTAPDLTQTGICTISLVNGVGCYTFVNS